MSFRDLKEDLIITTLRYWEDVSTKVKALDSATLESILYGGLAVIGLLGMLLIVRMLHSASSDETVNEVSSSSDVSVLIRDLASRISNYTTLSKEEHLYLKQELAILRDAMGNSQRLNDIEQTLENLSARISSYANLIREEYSTLKQDIAEVRKTLQLPVTIDRHAQANIGRSMSQDL